MLFKLTFLCNLCILLTFACDYTISMYRPRKPDVFSIGQKKKILFLILLCQLKIRRKQHILQNNTSELDKMLL